VAWVGLTEDQAKALVIKVLFDDAEEAHGLGKR
jgi:hypothetical protein